MSTVMMESPVSQSRFRLLRSTICLSLVDSPRLRNDLYCVGWGVKLYSLTPTIGVRDVGHLSSRGDSDQNFGRATVLVGAVHGLLSDRERWLLDRALSSIDDDSGCWVASFESTRCKHHAYQYTRSLTQVYT